MDVYSQIAAKIIQQQEEIIGPIAIEQAQEVSGMQLNWSQHAVIINGNPVDVVDELTTKYKDLFGQIAIQVSKESVSNLLSELPKDKQPKTLQ